MASQPNSMRNNIALAKPLASPLTSQTDSTLRSKRYMWGVSVSFLSKLTGASIQLSAIPIAIGVLGVDTYVAYASVLAIAAWPILFTVNFGPRLVASIASTHDRDQQAILFRNCAGSTLCNVLLVLILFLLSLTLFSAESAFPSLAFLGGNRATFLVATIGTINVLSLLFSVPEAFQVGFQRHYLISLVSICGNLLSLLLVSFAIPIFKSVEVLALSLSAPLFIARLVNATVFLRSHLYLLDNWKEWLTKPRLGNKELREGIAFTLVTGIAAYLVNQFPLLLLAKFDTDSSKTAMYASLLVMLGALMQPISMLIAPIIPAISNSLAIGDIGWVKRAFRRLSLLVVTYSLLATIGLYFAGPYVYAKWSVSLHASPVLLFFLGTYLFSVCAESSLFWLYHVVGNLRYSYSLYALRTVATVIAAIGLCSGMELWQYFAMVTVTTLSTLVLPLFISTIRILKTKTLQTPSI
jgi:O-antigen/teichoic acid export membrane protein